MALSGNVELHTPTTSLCGGGTGGKGRLERLCHLNLVTS